MARIDKKPRSTIPKDYLNSLMPRKHALKHVRLMSSRTIANGINTSVEILPGKTDIMGKRKKN